MGINMKDTIGRTNKSRVLRLFCLIRLFGDPEGSGSDPDQFGQRLGNLTTFGEIQARRSAVKDGIFEIGNGSQRVHPRFEPEPFLAVIFLKKYLMLVFTQKWMRDEQGTQVAADFHLGLER